MIRMLLFFLQIYVCFKQTGYGNDITFSKEMLKDEIQMETLKNMEN